MGVKSLAGVNKGKCKLHKQFYLSRQNVLLKANKRKTKPKLFIFFLPGSTSTFLALVEQTHLLSQDQLDKIKLLDDIIDEWPMPQINFSEEMQSFTSKP